MRRSRVLLLLAVALALLAGTPAQANASQAPVPAASCASPAPHSPCGYITPILDLAFPKKPACQGLPGAIDASKCIPMPADGASLRFDGSVRWHWRESDDLAYPIDPSQPITITLGPSPKDPTWLPFKVEPSSFTITSADLAAPNNTRVDTSGTSPVLYFWFERPVSVTFTRTGGPDDPNLTVLADNGGVQAVYLRARSTASGSAYKEAFGGEEFRFNATLLVAAPGSSQAAPGPAPSCGLLVALAAARVRRYRISREWPTRSARLIATTGGAPASSRPARGASE